jgi:synaptojanin
LSVYSRAELKGSDHRPGKFSHFLPSWLNVHWSIAFPVYAAFRATVHVIDHEKKAVLGRLLAESVASTAPGETLDEKLAALTFSHRDDCKPS